MTEPVVLELFGPADPIDAEQLARNLNRLIDCVNRLGRDERFASPTLSPSAVADVNSYRVVGSLVCDGLVIDGVQAPVVAVDRLATVGTMGLVRQAPVATLGTLPTPPAAAVDAIGTAVNGLLVALRAAGAMAE